MTTHAVQHLLRDQRIWRANDNPQAQRQLASTHSTGFANFDAALPSGGWLQRALNEILHDADGMGELQIVLPALARISQARQRVLWVGQPYHAYPQALTDAGLALSHCYFLNCSDNSGECKKPPYGNASRTSERQKHTLWAMEQALRAGCCEAVLGWLQDSDDRSLRRLQLAAEEGHSTAIIFRPARFSSQASPAALRVQLSACEQPLQQANVKILKCRGGNPPAQRVALALHTASNNPTH
jgi:hypothetical protein